MIGRKKLPNMWWRGRRSGGNCSTVEGGDQPVPVGDLLVKLVDFLSKLRDCCCLVVVVGVVAICCAIKNLYYSLRCITEKDEIFRYKKPEYRDFLNEKIRQFYLQFY
jgi:hypothetical protein